MPLRRSTRIASKNKTNIPTFFCARKDERKSTPSEPLRKGDKKCGLEQLAIAAEHINIMENEGFLDRDFQQDCFSLQDSQETELISEYQETQLVERGENLTTHIDNDLIVFRKDGEDTNDRKHLPEEQSRVCVFDDCGYTIFQDLSQYVSEKGIQESLSPPFVEPTLNQNLNLENVEQNHCERQDFRDTVWTFQNNDYISPWENEINCWQDEYDGFNSHNIIHSSLFRQNAHTGTLNQTFGHSAEENFDCRPRRAENVNCHPRTDSDSDSDSDSYELKSENMTDKSISDAKVEIGLAKDAEGPKAEGGQKCLECDAENARMKQICSAYLKKYKEKVKEKYTLRYKSKYKLKYKLKYKRRFGIKYESLKKYVKKSFRRISHSLQ
jgi:hypothetical protein